jgi:hypothetical protein
LRNHRVKFGQQAAAQCSIVAHIEQQLV